LKKGKFESSELIVNTGTLTLFPMHRDRQGRKERGVISWKKY